jgi:hypothetical protein
MLQIWLHSTGYQIGVGKRGLHNPLIYMAEGVGFEVVRVLLDPHSH